MARPSLLVGLGPALGVWRSMRQLLGTCRFRRLDAASSDAGILPKAALASLSSWGGLVRVDSRLEPSLKAASLREGGEHNLAVATKHKP